MTIESATPVRKVRLTRRETQVVGDLLMGLTLVEIRIKRDMSSTNVRNTASRAYNKCGVGTAHQLVVAYYRHHVEFLTQAGKFV